MEGSTLKLKCVVNSEPFASKYWRKVDKLYQLGTSSGHISAEQKGKTMYLTFKPLKLSDAGKYTCKATNRIGSNERDVKVAVYKNTEYAPSIVIPQKTISADINSNVTIICVVDGNPKPKVKWSKIGQDFTPSDGVISKQEKIGKKYRYSLIISKVRESNEGTYQCVASNKIRTITKTLDLQVSSKYITPHCHNNFYAFLSCLD